MQPFPRKLDSWVQAGLITQAQKDAIVAFETRDDETEPANVSVPEALGYVGAALAFGAVGLVLRGVWQQLLPLGRIGLALAVALIFGASAYLLEDRPTETSNRLTSVLTAVTIFSIVGVAILALEEYTGWSSPTRVAVVAVVFALASATAYARRPRPLFVLLLFASGLSLVGAALVQPVVPVNVFAGAMLFWVYALCWLLLTIGQWIAPRRPALIVGALGSVVSLQVARAGEIPALPLVLGILTAAALVWFSLRVHDQVILAIAAATVFVFVPQLSFVVFADSLGAAGALLVSGLALVGVATVSNRVRRNVPPEDPAIMLTESRDDDV